MRVLITGITGFVGSHLAEYLLQQDGVDLWGTVRWRSNTESIDHVRDRIHLFECDLRDASSVRNLLEKATPDYVFHLAAQSFVPMSWHAPGETLSTNINGTLNLFEAVRSLGVSPRIHVAGSSEEYGFVHPEELPITESNPLRPLSPYAVSKAAAALLGYKYFMSYGLHIVRTRAFNHTGPRRGDVFVASGFARQLAEVRLGRRPPLIQVGNLSVVRDFTDVRDVVRAYWLALTHGNPGDVYNICSGTGVRIEDLLDMLIDLAGVEVKVEQDPSRLRPVDVPILVGNCDRLRTATGWAPEIPFNQTLSDLLTFWTERLGVEKRRILAPAGGSA